MKVFGNETYLTIGEVAAQIGRSTQTIKSWYEYQEKEGVDVLPEIHYLDKKRTRYFKEEDVPFLIEFRDSIKYGMMAEVSRTKWGERGKK